MQIFCFQAILTELLTLFSITNDSVVTFIWTLLLNEMALVEEKGKIFLILLLLWCAYVVIGIFVFSAVEGNVQHSYPDREAEGNTSREDDNYHERRWGYGDSFWFVIVLLTTIGKKQGFFFAIFVRQRHLSYASLTLHSFDADISVTFLKMV